MRIRVAEKPFQILELLLKHAGHVVTRQTLRQKLWPNTHVGYEHSLNTAVNTLREMLGDSAQNPRYIETLPRLGYRFMCSVSLPPEAASFLHKKMLAVLPFENLSSDRHQEYFAEGLTEEITSHLGQLDPRHLGVIARTSALQYKRSNKSILEIASELRVDCVLEGSVRHSGNNLRITVQLVNAADQAHLWSTSFDRHAGDTLAVQSDVARAIGAALLRELLPQPQPVPANAEERQLSVRSATGSD